MATYKIIFKGEICENSDRDKIELVLAKFFKIPVAKANKLFNGNAYALKKGIDVDDAIAMQQKLLGIGVITRLIKEETLASDITYQTPAPELPETNSIAPSVLVKSTLIDKLTTLSNRCLTWGKTPKAKKIGYVFACIGIISMFSKNYFVDCNSGTTKSALTKLIVKTVSAATQLADDQFDTELSGIMELKFNENQSTYTCKARVVLTDIAGNVETNDVVYQVIKRGFSKPQVKIP
ncbi:MAG: hypothetical protein JKY81_09635 [Colwellia sp.]|nr:hypothetical protein [Colwellia sp.]